jgi:electron transfer flavoprotein beta subunit
VIEITPQAYLPEIQADQGGESRMDIIVLLKMVPDVVEELEIASNEKSLDTEWLRMIISEPCEHALEQALLLKEGNGGNVTVVALEAPEVDDVLYTALAKGVDRAIKIPGDWTGISSPSEALIYSTFLSSGGVEISNDTLILTGSQAIDDLAGEQGAFLANMLHVPYIGVVTGVSIDIPLKKVTAIKEFSGGLQGQFEASLPAVLGIQAAEKPLRYVPVAKIRSVMKSTQYETREVSPPAVTAGYTIMNMFKKEVTGKAEMLEGSPDEIVHRLADIFTERGHI